MLTLNDRLAHIVRDTRVPKAQGPSYAVVGLVGEAGEVANLYKKVLRGDYTSLRDARPEMTKELGDVLWYVTALALDLDITLDQIVDVLEAKLDARKTLGTLDRAKARKGEIL